MTWLRLGLVTIVAGQHFAFMILETFLWETPVGRKIFRLSEQDARTTASLAANQGLYNGFLAAGLLWSLVTEPLFALRLQTFFLLCVFLAGVFGAVTVNRRIFFVQGIPALVGLALLLIQS